MKKSNLFLSAILLISLASTAQTQVVEAKQIKAVDSLKLKTNWIKSLLTDTALTAATKRDIASAEAIKTYIANRLAFVVQYGDTSALLAGYARINRLLDSLSAVQTRIQSKEPLLGFTPENNANKATSFGTINNNLYPTVAAVNNEINTALNSYVPKTTTVNGHALSSDVTVTKSDVGLSNVPNTDATNASNISTGTLADARLSSNVTVQGNTFNGANQLLKLDGSGKLPTATIPSLALVETFVVGSQAAMLALSAQMGDVAVRTDNNYSYILQAEPASTLGNWVQLLVPSAESDPVYTASSWYSTTNNSANWTTAYSWGNWAANSHYIGTTSIANNRASGSQTLTGVSIDGNAATATAVAWSGVTSKPTTIAGYGITDYNSLGDTRWQPLENQRLGTSNSPTFSAVTVSSATQAYFYANRVTAGGGEVGFQLQTGGTTDWYIYNPTGDQNTLNFYKGGIKMSINASGNLNITGTLNGTSATLSSFVEGSYFQTAAIPATSGGVRLGTQVAVRARNVANTANIELIASDASDRVSIGAGAPVLIGGTLGVTGAATFSNDITVNGSIYSGPIVMNRTGGYGILAKEDGNNTAATSAYIGFVNAAATRYFISQLDASNNIRYHYYNGSSWSTPITFTNDGAVLISTTAALGDANDKLVVNGSGHIAGQLTAKTYSTYTTSVSSNYTVSPDVGIVFCNGTSSSFTVTLPSAVDYPGRHVTLSRTDCDISETITISGSADITSLVRRAGLIFVSDGSTWRLVGEANYHSQCD